MKPPQGNSDYKIYKPALREEFSYTCAYCGSREPELGGSKSFHIDHYKPKSKFPHLLCHYPNLLYACRDCNQYKGNYWPNRRQQLLRQSIINPRLDLSTRHFDMSNFAWTGRTLQGKWNIEKLRLDSAILSQRRKDRTSLEGLIQKLESELAKLYKAKAKGADPNSIDEDIAIQINQINTLKRKTNGPMD